MNLNDLYTEVSRRADTCGTHINVAEVSRVCAMLFTVLSDKTTEDVLMTVAHGITVAKTKTETIAL
jgi:hypothetical protein